MISIKSDRELELLREAGRIVALCHSELKKVIKPGITTIELNDLATKIIEDNDAYPSFLEVDNFPCAICSSPNEQVVHGIANDQPLKEGDIISIDIGAKYKGYHGDSAWTYPVGNISDDDKYLLEHTEKSLYEGLNVIREGIHLSDVSNAIETYANKYNLGIVREFAGHGVGKSIHEEPQILNYGPKGRGPILKAGMVLAIEPMLNFGSDDIVFHNDGWTISTSDKKNSAHFEHTIIVTTDGYEITTQLGG
ncbi:MAG: type I methionyl aminopeptidase [Mycoplasmatales bacterium]